ILAPLLAGILSRVWPIADRQPLTADLRAQIITRPLDQPTYDHCRPAGNRRTAVGNARRIRRAVYDPIDRQSEAGCGDLRQDRFGALPHVRVGGQYLNAAVRPAFDPDLRLEHGLAAARE